MYSKKKDREPVETISIIKNILTNLGIELKELWAPSSPYLYAVRLKYNNIVFSEGKGTSKEYALASAYGELIERLQNGYIRSIMPTNFFAKLNATEIRLEDFLKQDNIFAKELIYQYLTPIHSQENETKKQHLNSIDELFETVLGEKVSSINCVEFYSLKEKKNILLPYDILSSLHSGNGMCAGNTMEEALVQGFSEIIERYVGYSIITNKLVPPDVPASEYSCYPEILEMISYYEKLGFTVHVKDCSLGKKLPAIGVFLIDKKAQKYASSIAANPLLPVALERCFTELRQERDPSITGTDKLMLDFPFDKTKQKTLAQNIELYAQKTVIQFDINFFAAKPNWDYDATIWANENNSNKELLKNIINVISKISDNIYIRDVSFLGFPAYYIVIPDFSVLFTDKEYVRCRRLMRTIYDLLLSNDLSTENVSKIISAINFNKEINNWLSNPDLIKMFNDYYSLAACYFHIGEYDKAYENISKYAETLNLKEALAYTNCTKLLINYKRGLITKEEYEKNLELFFEENIISFINQTWVEISPLQHIIDCSITAKECPLEDNSSQKDILNRLQAHYKNNPPKQDALKILEIA